MTDSIQQIALHESGHALAHILTGLPFSFVTINPSKINNDGESLGYILPIKPYYGAGSGTYNKLSPPEFFQCFSEDITIIAGYVAQRVFTKNFDRTGSNTDIRILYSNRMMNQDEPFRTLYRNFLFSYTFELFKLTENKRMIKKIADELLKYETLNYGQVKEIINR
jgi:hypothetical protein